MSGEVIDGPLMTAEEREAWDAWRVEREWRVLWDGLKAECAGCAWPPGSADVCLPVSEPWGVYQGAEFVAAFATRELAARYVEAQL